MVMPLQSKNRQTKSCLFFFVSFLKLAVLIYVFLESCTYEIFFGFKFNFNSINSKLF
jgi:hypothetical protein